MARCPPSIEMARHATVQELSGSESTRSQPGLLAPAGGSTYRAVYTVKFSGAVYVLHVFQKKSKKGAKTPHADINLIRKRLNVAEEHYEKWRASQEEQESTEPGSGG